MDAFRAKLDRIVDGVTAGSRARSRADVDAVLDMGTSSLDELYALLATPSAAPSVRATAAWIIGRLDDPRGVAALLAVLDDGVADVRRQAIIEIGHLGATAAVPTLVRLLDGNEATREVAAWALGQVGDVRAQPRLLELLADPEQPAGLRGQAAESLATIDDAIRAVPALIAAADDREVAVRFWTAFALGAIGDPRALDVLDGLASDDASMPGYSTVSEEACAAAAAIRARQARV